VAQWRPKRLAQHDRNGWHNELRNSQYYPPNTMSHFTFTFDMDKTDKAAEIIFDSIDDYKELFSKASKDYKDFVNQMS